MKKRKTYEISVIDKTYSKTISDETKFYTSDTALELAFELKETEYNFESAEIVLLNVDDRSLATRPVSKVNNNFVYEIDDDITSHYGDWRGQLMLVENGEVHVSSPIKFRIENDFYCNKPLEITEVVSWVSLKRYANGLIDELKQAVLGAEGIEDAFNANETTRQNTFETNESERDVTFNTNETTRQENEDARIEAEKQREGTVTEIENRQTLVETQFDAVQQELTDKDPISAPEIIAARGGEPTLSARLDKEQQEVNSLATANQKTNVSDTSSLVLSKKSPKRPLVSFIDDDGYSEVLTRLKPIFDAKGIKGTLAIVSSWVGKDGCLSHNDLIQLQDEGWEIASHEKTHIAMSSVTDDDAIRREIVESKIDLLRMGMNVKNIVYPFGQNNAKMIEIVKQNYRAGTITNAATNDTTVTFPLDTYYVRRVDFSGATLDHYKSVIDKAVSESSWVVFMTHIKVQKPEYDTMLATLIDYIQSKGVDIVTFDKGLDTFGDIVSIDGVGRMIPDGSIISDKIVPIYRTPTNDVTADTPISYFKLGGVTKTQITSVGAATFPEGKGGVLTTDRTFKDGGYQTQTYQIYNMPTVYERYCTTGGVWSAFQKQSQVVPFTLRNYDFGSVPANGTVTYDVVIPNASLSVVDPIIMTTASNLPNNMTATARVHNGTTIKISVKNPNPTAYSTFNNTYNGYVLK